jgi:hypothetical protein
MISPDGVLVLPDDDDDDDDDALNRIHLSNILASIV